MPAIHIRNVPEATVAALRERAAHHQRSMQAELRQILEEAAAQPPSTDAPDPIRLITKRASSAGSWRREDVYDDAGR